VEKEEQKKVNIKLELVVIRAPNIPDPVKTHKLLASLKVWDRDIWGDPEQEFNDESSEESELPEPEFKVAPYY